MLWTLEAENQLKAMGQGHRAVPSPTVQHQVLDSGFIESLSNRPGRLAIRIDLGIELHGCSK
eukprot:gene25952-biopygen12139